MKAESRGMQGHLRLVCGLDARGVSVLREQSFGAPVHLSKPHWEGDTVVVNVVNPTPGLFDGDFIRQEVRVESGAGLLLTAPSATRVHQMRGGYATLEQRFRVAAGGFLEVLPEMLIPQRGARYRQSTEVRLERDATCFLFETVAPGRVAAGEVLAYDWLEWRNTVWIGDTCALLERSVWSPENPQMKALSRVHPHPWLGSVFAAGPFLAESPIQAAELKPLEERFPWMGWSVTCAPSAYVFRVVTGDPIQLRQILSEIRVFLHRKAHRPLAGFRRIAGR